MQRAEKRQSIVDGGKAPEDGRHLERLNDFTQCRALGQGAPQVHVDSGISAAAQDDRGDDLAILGMQRRGFPMPDDARQLAVRGVIGWVHAGQPFNIPRCRVHGICQVCFANV